MRRIKIGSTYKHFKGGIYKVIDIVYDCESKGEKLDKVVIYQGVNGKKLKWARKYEDFCSLVDKEKYPDIKQKYRFELIEHNFEDLSNWQIFLI